LAAHPRLEQRRRTIRRSAAMAAWRPWFRIGAAAVIVVALGVVALFSPVLAVRTVTVEFSGSSAQQAELAAIAGHLRGRNMIRANVDGANAALLDLAWVSSASVRRSFPNSVVVRVRAHDVAGSVVLPDGRVALTSTDGSVLSVVSVDDASVAGLPRFDLNVAGQPVAGDALVAPAAAVLSSAASFSRRGVAQLVRVELRRDDVIWTVRPRDGGIPIRVLVGTARESDVPAAALTSVLSRSGPRPVLVDLRTPDTPILQFAPRRAKR
jgi:cell division protein FtsQ